MKWNGNFRQHSLAGVSWREDFALAAEKDGEGGRERERVAFQAFKQSAFQGKPFIGNVQSKTTSNSLMDSSSSNRHKLPRPNLISLECD